MGKSTKPVVDSPAQQAPLSSSSTNAPVESEDEHAPSPKKRASGLDLLRLAKVSGSEPGHLPSYKTGDSRYVHQLFISTREEALALYLEFYPLVQFYQRGDAIPKVAEREEIASPLGTPFPIPYTWDDATHTYYPDFVGKLIDGRLLITEAGRAKAKRTERELAKAAVARQFAEEHNGIFWIATEEQLRSVWYQNIQRLHTRRMEFPQYRTIRDALLATLPWGTFFSVKDIVDESQDSFPKIEVEGAIWKMIGDAAASGHLVVDLAAQHITRYSRLALQDPTLDPILPIPLPHGLQWVEAETAQPGTQTMTVSVGQRRDTFGTVDSSFDDENDLLLVNSSELPGQSIDPGELPETIRDRYERNRAAVYDVLHSAQIRVALQGTVIRHTSEQ